MHGSAPDIAGKGIANPTAMLLSACMMLEHIGQGDVGGRIRAAIRGVLAQREILTPDLNGTASTAEYAEAVVKALD